jgi:hypothetical protein
LETACPPKSSGAVSTRSRWVARLIRVDLKPAEAIPLAARLLNLPAASAMVAASHHMQINLSRLGDGNFRTMVGQMAASKALGDDAIATLVERTSGSHFSSRS